MTPSEAHDSAWKRDAGHDAMQLAVMRAWRDQFPTVLAIPTYQKEEREHRLQSWSAEAMFEPRSGKAFFADLAFFYRVEWQREHAHGAVSVDANTHVVVLEVKPVIHSAGAVIRQCRVAQSSLDKWCRQRSNDVASASIKTTGVVAPVVKASDPLVRIVADLWQWGVWTWDGERLDWFAGARMR